MSIYVVLTYTVNNGDGRRPIEREQLYGTDDRLKAVEMAKKFARSEANYFEETPFAFVFRTDEVEPIEVLEERISRPAVSHRDLSAVFAAAEEIVLSDSPMTRRQLYYSLLKKGVISDTTEDYNVVDTVAKGLRNGMITDRSKYSRSFER